MTNEEIHNIYLHMTGKAEGLAEATGSADFPVMFAKAILEFDRMQRPWVWLTEDEVNQTYEHVEQSVDDHWKSGGKNMMFPTALYKAIEAKLKKKNT